MVSLFQEKELQESSNAGGGKERDHRKLGKEMELFTFSNKVGQGLPLWLPKGTKLKEKLENFLRKAQESWLFVHINSSHWK